MADSDKPVKPRSKRSGTIQQIIRVYQAVRQYDKQVDLWLAGSFLAPIVLLVVLGLIMRWHWVTWIFWMITAVLCGILAAMFVLSKRADRLQYRLTEGKLGGSIATIAGLSRLGYHFPQEPIWMDPKRQEAIWRGTGYGGIYLIGEGAPERINKAMDQQERDIKSVTQGSAIPVYRVLVGEGQGQVPLKKLRNHITKLKSYVPSNHTWSLLRTVHPRSRFMMTKQEVTTLNDRLRTLQTKRGLPIPHGIDPTRRQRISRRALRGK